MKRACEVDNERLLTEITLREEEFNVFIFYFCEESFTEEGGIGEEFVPN
jgi:hypothetical protein